MTHVYQERSLQPSYFDKLLACRYNNFDFIRLVLAISVIYGHSFFLLHHAQASTSSLLHRQELDVSAIAVNFFFAISGLLVTASWMRSGSWRVFLRNRIYRIYPGFIIACLFCALIVGPLLSNHYQAYLHQIQWRRFALGLATLQKFEPTLSFGGNPNSTSLNGSLWTIRIEFECYLLVMLLGSIRLLNRRSTVLIASLFVYLTYAWCLLHLGPKAISSNIVEKLRFLSYFLAGTVFYLYQERVRFSAKWFAGSLLLLFCFGFTGNLDFVLPIGGVYALFYLACTPQLKLHRFTRYGDLSYGVYLYGWPVQILLIHYLNQQLNPYQLMFWAVPITSVLAFLSWHCVENPFMKLKRRPEPSHAIAAVPPLIFPTANSCVMDPCEPNKP